MNAAKTKLTYGTALDVKEGDVILTQGIRCRVSDVSLTKAEDMASGCMKLDTARYTLHSEPSDERPGRLPPGYEGMRSGGNRYAEVVFEVTE